MAESSKKPFAPWSLWEDYWFPQTTCVRLAVMRIITVALQMVWFMWPLQNHVDYINRNEGFNRPQLLIRALAKIAGEDTLRTVPLFTAIWWGTLLAGCLAVVGLYSRTMVFIFALLSMILQAHAYSYGDKHHPEAIYLIFIMLMAFGPCGRCLSIDALIGKLRGKKAGDLVNATAVAAKQWGTQAVTTTAMWPLHTVKWLLAIAYLNAGLCKIQKGGLDWFNGYTLQGYLLQDGIWHDRPLGVWLAKQHNLCIAMSYGSVLFECTFFLCLFIPRLAPVMIAGGVAIHMGIYILQAAPFFQFMVLYLVWFPFEKLPWFKRS